MARPSIFKPEFIEQICARLSEGEPLAQICREDGMPSYSAIWDWMNQRPEVKEAIARAREHGEDVLAAGCLEIADDGTNDWMERAENKGWEFNGENVQRSKLRIETRLKLLAKWNPKKYGERIENRLADPEGNALKIVVTGIQPTEENT